MLPDFPELKKELNDRLAMHVKAEASNDPLLAAFPSFVIHEGRRAELTRSDGTSHQMNFDNPMSARTTVSAADVRTKGGKAALEAAREIAAQLQQAMAERAVASLQEAVEAIGNSLDGGGRPLSAEMILEMWDKMELSFDADGNWEQPTLLIHPNLEARAAEAYRRILNEPELRARRDAIVNRQRREWRVREARRKLAD